MRETYPVELAKQEFSVLEENNLKNILKSGKDSDTLRKVLLPHFEYGPNLLEHLCLQHGIALNTKLKAGVFILEINITDPHEKEKECRSMRKKRKDKRNTALKLKGYNIYEREK